MSKGQIQQRVAAGAGMSTEAYTQAVQSKLSPGLAAAAQQFKVSNAMDAAIDNTVSSPSAAAVNARFMAMHNSTTEAPLLNAAMMQRAGIKLPDPRQLGGRLRLLPRWPCNNPRVTSQFKAMREQAMASCRATASSRKAPEMSSLTGIADAMKRKFPKGMNETPEQIQRSLLLDAELHPAALPLRRPRPYRDAATLRSASATTYRPAPTRRSTYRPQY